MTVHLAGTLPDADLNGLAAIERRLLEGHLRGTRHLVLGVVTVTGTKASVKEGFKPNPIVSLQHVEAVPDELEEQILSLMQDLLVKRTGGDTLNFPDEEPPSAPEPLALGSSDGEYRVEIKDTAPGVFAIRLLDPSDALIAERFELPRSTFGELPPAVYRVWELNEALKDLASALVAEFEAGFTVDDVVDGEVVEDEEAE